MVVEPLWSILKKGVFTRVGKYREKKKKYMASRVTSTDDKGKTEGGIWPFTCTLQLRKYCKIHTKKFCKYNFYLFRPSITPTLHWATIDGAKKCDNPAKSKTNCTAHVLNLHHRVVAICTSCFRIFKPLNFAQRGYLCISYVSQSEQHYCITTGTDTCNGHMVFSVRYKMRLKYYLYESQASLGLMYSIFSAAPQNVYWYFYKNL
jgi:hypothetical protein